MAFTLVPFTYPGPSAHGSWLTLQVRLRSAQLQLDAHDLWIVVAGLMGEFGVDVDYFIVCVLDCGTDKDVVNELRVALVDVGITLIDRQRVDQVPQHVAGREGLHRRGKLKVVEIAQNDDRGLRVRGQQFLDEIVFKPDLLGALDFAGTSSAVGNGPPNLGRRVSS